MWYCKECGAGTPQTCKCEARRLAELDAWYTEKNRLERARAKAPELLECLRVQVRMLEIHLPRQIVRCEPVWKQVCKARALIAEIEGDSE